MLAKMIVRRAKSSDGKSAEEFDEEASAAEGDHGPASSSLVKMTINK
jgi:hypothetical protein